MLIDSHCHLDFPDFAGELDAVVTRAQAAGIARIVTISTRVKRHAEVLAITVSSHAQLEQLLRGFNAAYNARRQRVLEGQTPDQVVAERLTAKPALATAKPSGRAAPDDIIKARLIAESAKEVSQPDS